jgi:hypothetical protein
LSGWIYHHLLLTNWVLTITAPLRRWVFERTISTFGVEGPNGERPDMADFRRRRFRGQMAHGLLHPESGDPSVALASFLEALKLRPTAARTLGYAVMSLAKLIIHGAHQVRA